MADALVKLGTFGLVGVLAGLVAVAVVRPDTPGGTALLVGIFVVTFMAVGKTFTYFARKKETRKAEQAGSSSSADQPEGNALPGEADPNSPIKRDHY